MRREALEISKGNVGKSFSFNLMLLPRENEMNEETKKKGAKEKNHRKTHLIVATARRNMFMHFSNTMLVSEEETAADVSFPRCDQMGNKNNESKRSK